MTLDLTNSTARALRRRVLRRRCLERVATFVHHVAAAIGVAFILALILGAFQ